MRIVFTALLCLHLTKAVTCFLSTHFLTKEYRNLNHMLYQAIPPLPLEKPDVSDLEYHQTILPNGIKTTLVRDEGSEKAACSLGVCVGAKHDPNSYPGLAHFTGLTLT